MNDTVIFDVMLNGYFVRTFEYRICPPNPISERELYNFVVGKLPTLKGKQFKIRFNGDDNKKGGKR